MKMSALAKCVGLVALAGALMAPAASFADGAFMFGGPGYQAPPHVSAVSSGRRAFAYEPEAGTIAAAPRWHAGSRLERACLRPPFSMAFEPCYEH